MPAKKETPKPRKLKIVGWDNDPDCGEFTFAEFEDDPSSKLLPDTAQEKAIRWLDNLLDGTSRFRLISRLNDIQGECNLDRDPPPFPNKFAMPLGIVNLLIKEFGLTIEED